MIVSIVGGHGGIARQLTPLLRERGHTVRGLIRNSAQMADLRADGAEPVVCDLERSGPDDVDEALDGSDVVVFAAGAGPDSGPERKKSLDRDGAIEALRSAVRVGAERFVIVSSMGTDDPPEDGDDFSVYLRAKAAADEAVRAAEIAHTIVRPGRLTDDEPTGRVEVGESVEPGSIPRGDVARLLAEVVDRPSAASARFEVVSGATPIADAVKRFG